MTSDELLKKWRNDLLTAHAIFRGLGYLYRVDQSPELRRAQQEFHGYAGRLENAIDLLEQMDAKKRSVGFPRIPTLDSIPRGLACRIRKMVMDHLAVVAALPVNTPDVTSISIVVEPRI